MNKLAHTLINEALAKIALAMLLEKTEEGKKEITEMVVKFTEKHAGRMKWLCSVCYANFITN